MLTMDDPRWEEFIEKMMIATHTTEEEIGEDADKYLENLGDNCTHNFRKARKVLREMGYNKKEIAHTLEYCETHGGYCDCEILLNVVM